MKKLRHFVGGQWVSPAENTIYAINPATEETIAEFCDANTDTVNTAVAAASTALKSSWGTSTGRERAEFLDKIADCFNSNVDELARLEVEDNGKPLPEAKWDIEDAAGCFSMYAELARELDDRQGTIVTLPDRSFTSKVYYEPVGVAGQIIPWNFPLLMATWKVAPALAAGATVVLKPSELTSLTALKLGEYAQAVDLPAGVLNIITGYGKTAGALLAQHDAVEKIAFTGSVPTGSTIMRGAADQIKNISLELGGKSPFLIFEDSDIEAAIEWIMFGIFWNQGEVCSATSRVLIHESIYATIVDRLVEESKKIKIGNGMDDGVLLGPLISGGQRDKIFGMIQRAVDSGATLLAGGGIPKGLETGYFIEPTILADVNFDAEAWNEEIFGPVVCVAPFRTEEDAVRIANNSRYGLAAAVMSDDKKRCERVARSLKAGIVWLNCSQPTFSEAPWGGMKQSGLGRELGQWGLDNYLETKQVTSYEDSRPWGWYLK